MIASIPIVSVWVGTSRRWPLYNGRASAFWQGGDLPNIRRFTRPGLPRPRWVQSSIEHLKEDGHCFLPPNVMRQITAFEVMCNMQKRPQSPTIKEDQPFIATNRLIMIIGSSRYALDISTKCTKLTPSRAEVIRIDRQLKERTPKPTPK
jgi:hypothetical protein